MDRASAAYGLMVEQRTNCAQAILSTFSEQFGLERTLALRLAQGFAGGMVRLGNVCGATTGACMVLGLSQKVPPTTRVKASTQPTNSSGSSTGDSERFTAR